MVGIAECPLGYFSFEAKQPARKAYGDPIIHNHWLVGGAIL